MRTIDIVTLVLLIVGGLNWGLVGALDIDLVTAMFGTAAAESAPASTLSRIIYILVALSALWQLRMIPRLSSTPARV